VYYILSLLFSTILRFLLSDVCVCVLSIFMYCGS